MNTLGDIFRALKAEDLGDPIDVIIPAYWWLVDHHSGYGTWQYESQCRLGQTYDPGTTTLESEPDYIIEAYNLLCDLNGCDHKDRVAIDFDE